MWQMFASSRVAAQVLFRQSGATGAALACTESGRPRGPVRLRPARL